MKQICVKVSEHWARIIGEAIREGLFESIEEFVAVAVARLASDIEGAMACRQVIEGPEDVGEVVRPCTYVIEGDEVVITDTLSKDEFLEFIEGVRLSRESGELISTYLSMEDMERDESLRRTK